MHMKTQEREEEKVKKTVSTEAILQKVTLRNGPGEVGPLF